MMLNGGEVGMAKFDNRERLRFAAAVDACSRAYDESPTPGRKAAWLAAEDAYNHWLQQFKMAPHRSWVVLWNDTYGTFVKSHAFRDEVEAHRRAGELRDRAYSPAIKLIEWEDGEGL